jgi:hemoglobin
MSGLRAYLMELGMPGDGRSGFELIGGAAGVREVVTRWLRVIAADGELSPYLVGVDPVRLGRHLAEVLTAALGGPGSDAAARVSGAGAWRGLGLAEEQHRRVVDYLAGMLRERAVPVGLIGVVVRVFADEAAR